MSDREGDPHAEERLNTASSARVSFSNSGEDSSDPCDDLNDAERSSDSTVRPRAGGVWAADEHERFLRGMQRFPMGPWSAIAAVVGTRSVRQVHSHAQKYAAKVERHKRGQVKIKRNKIGGGEGSSSGHRVVPKIPGKFHCQVDQLPDQIEDPLRLEVEEILVRDTRASSCELNSEKDALGNTSNSDGLDRHWQGNITKSPDAFTRNESRPTTPTKPPSHKEKAGVDSRSSSLQPRSPRHIEAPAQSLTDARSLRHGDNDATETPLPSLEESLDFFILAFDELHRD